MFNCYGFPVSIGLIESQEMLGSLDGRFPTPERFVTVSTVEVAREKKYRFDLVDKVRSTTPLDYCHFIRRGMQMGGRKLLLRYGNLYSMNLHLIIIPKAQKTWMCPREFKAIFMVLSTTGQSVSDH